jgi:hypothetical protein
MSSRTIKNNTTEPFQQFLNNACLLGTHKNKKFLSWLFDRRKITIPGLVGAAQRDIRKGKEDFFKILDLFEEKYKGQADLGFYYDGNYTYPYFKVLYPKFTISNSQGRTHEIKDLFVYHSFKYSNGSVHPYKLEGGRFSKTDLEITSGYQQSHLGSYSSWKDNPFYCSNFCVGSDTDVSLMLAEFEIEMDFERYELFLFCVDTMITWESLEGVPYIKMENIQNANSGRVTNSDGTYENTIVSKIINDAIPLDVDFYVADGVYKIHPNLRASNFIKKLVLERYTFAVAKSIIVSKVPNTFNMYLQMKAEGATAKAMNKITATQDYTIFRGRKIFPRVIKEDGRKSTPISIDDYIVYPKFLENVLRKLETRIYEKAVVKSATEIHNSLSNANRGVTSDTVSV